MGIYEIDATSPLVFTVYLTDKHVNKTCDLVRPNLAYCPNRSSSHFSVSFPPSQQDQVAIYCSIKHPFREIVSLTFGSLRLLPLYISSTIIGIPCSIRELSACLPPQFFTFHFSVDAIAPEHINLSRDVCSLSTKLERLVHNQR